MRLMETSANLYQRLIGGLGWGNFLIGVGLFRTGLIKVKPNKVRWVMKFVELIFQIFRGLVRVRSFEEPMDF